MQLQQVETSKGPRMYEVARTIPITSVLCDPAIYGT
jgi:hypothetical protein